MASHRAAAAVLLMASLLVAVALSGTDAVRPDKTAAALSDDVRPPGGNRKLTAVRHDVEPAGPGYVAVAGAKPECDDEPEEPEEPEEPKVLPDHREDPENHKPSDNKPPEDPMTTESALDEVLCSDCEEPKKPEPPCNACEPKKEPELTCNKVHAVREGETCDSVGQCAELGHDDFLRFNPNLCCDNLFVGQWVCLDATCAA